MSSFYIIVNADLKMKKGKIAAQVSHVTRMAFRSHANCAINRVIVLKASQCQINQLIAKYCKDRDPIITYVVDAGLTQVKPGSITCLAVMPKQQVPPEVKQLKLL